MMSPLKDHDWIKRLIGRFIETMAYDLRIEIQSIGSTTITSDLIERGFEPDEAYYVANEPKVRGKKRFEPDVDPPPDLILEVDVTSSSRSREKLYAALKVPELWRHDGNDLVFFRRTRNGQYKAIARSLAFPFLTPADITRFLDQAESVSETKLTRRFAQWARRRKNESSSN